MSQLSTLVEETLFHSSLNLTFSLLSQSTVTCDNLPHFTNLHRLCVHWMQHYAALWISLCDRCYNQIDHCANRAAYFLYSLLFPDADLSFFVSCPFHLFTHLSFFTPMCLSVCWPGCYVLCSGCFRLQYHRCVCTFPRRWSCCRGRGPRCWCVWWIWWVTKQSLVRVWVWMWELVLLLLYTACPKKKALPGLN